MALVVKDDVKISEFINLSAAEKFLPAVMTSVKTVRISKVDKVIAMENDSLSDVDLLKGVKLVKDGYVCLAGLVVSGEWNLPDNCRGGVSVCLVDKRMQRDDEATLGSYRTSAAKKRFAFKLIPNYSITTADAERNVSQSRYQRCCHGKGFLSFIFGVCLSLYCTQIQYKIRLERELTYRDWETDRKSVV